MAEDHKERIDRELKELLEELRILVPGVQLLAAFLLTVAFMPPFEHLSVVEKRVYGLAFMSAVAATVLLLAPTAQHRMLWRHPEKERFLKVASRLAFIATVMLAVSILAVTYLIMEYVWSPRIGGAAALAVGATLTVLWYVVPVAERATGPKDETNEAPPAAAHPGTTPS
jgi:hypothetical protein